MRVLKYLLFTCAYGLHYTRYPTILVLMDCTILDILLYLKDIVMLIGYLMLKIQNPKVVMSYWEEQQCHRNPQNKLLFPDPRWNMSL